MKFVIQFSCCILLALFFAACELDKEKVEIQENKLTLYTPQEQVIEPRDENVVVRFYASNDWTVFVPEEAASWCMPVQTSGTQGETELLIMLAANDQPNDRNARITVSCGTETFSVFIVQKQANALTVTTDRFELEPEGGIISIEVKSNVDYKWEMALDTESWVEQIDEAEAARIGVLSRYAATRALSSETLYFRILPNEEAEVRVGSIVFYAEGLVGADGFPLEEVVNIYQRERNVVLLTKPEATMSDKGGTLKVEINSNVDFEVKMPEVNWIQHGVTTRALSTHTLYFQVLANETYDTREAEIVFYQKGNPNLADTLRVIQAEKEGLVLGSSVIEASEKGEIVEVLVNTNVETELTILSGWNWLKQVDTKLQTRALTENRYYLEVAPNDSYDERRGSVLVRGKGNYTLSQELEVVQGQQRYLKLNKDTLIVEPEGDSSILYFRTSVDYTVELTADWLHTSLTRSLNSRAIEVFVDPWTEPNQPMRQAFVIVKDTKSDLADTTVVMQKTLLHGKYQVSPAGSLPTLIPDDQKMVIRALKVSGKLNGTDLALIREMAGRKGNDKYTAGKLYALDLSEAEIVGGGDAYYARWGSGAVQPTETSYWYTADSNWWIEKPNGWTTTYYSEGIGDYMFKFCNLTTVVLPQGIRRIGQGAFLGSKLQILNIKENVPPVLGTGALNVSGPLTVYVPSHAVEAYRSAEGWKDLNIVSEEAL